MAENEGEEVQISFGDLNIGVLYPIRSAVKEMRKFGDRTVPAVKIDVSTSDLLVTTTYVPSGVLSFAQENIDNINQAYKNNKPYNACYYGAIAMSGSKNKDMKRFIGRIHAPGVGVIEKLFDEVARMNTMVTSSTDQKRGSSDSGGDPPAKQKKNDSSSS